MPVQYEEHREIGSGWSWTILILLCIVLVAWGVFNYLKIADAPRQWDLGALRDVPAQSIYSSSQPVPGAAVPRQIAPLPEGESLPARPGALP